MYIKIYFGAKPLFLCDAIDNHIQPFVHHDDAVFIDELNSHTIKSMIHEMEQPAVHAGVFFHSSLEELKKTFFKKFTLVIAAGGVVKNDLDEILFIFRRKRWDFPKGKLDEGEKPEICALREVEEETGVKNIRLGELITTTYHSFFEGTRHVLKETHWFSMTASGEQKLKPQQEEQIEDIRWVAPKEVNQYLHDTYPLITDIIIAAEQKKFIVLQE